MATTSKDEFKLDIPCHQIDSFATDVKIPCHLSPKISAISMEIRWFKGTDCVCLYKNGQVTEGRGYESRVSLFKEELETGKVSLKMRNCKELDSGSYLCQVISSFKTEELTIEVTMLSNEYGLMHKMVKAEGTWTEEERVKMEESTLLTEFKAKNMLELWKRSLVERKRDQEQLEETRMNLEQTLKKLKDAEEQLQGFEIKLAERDQKICDLEAKMEKRNELEDSQTTDVKETSGLTSDKRANSHDLPPNLEEESGATSPEAVPTSGLRLVLVGRSGHGKSAAGNTILDREEKIQAGGSTECQQSESRQGEVAGRMVTVVETPDWFSPELSLEDLRQDVGLCIRLSAPGPHAFLLVVPVKKSEGEETGMLEKMEEIFWERCWRNTMILFTVTNDQQKTDIEEWLQTGDQEIQRLVEKCGNRFHCLNINEREDASQVSGLLEKIKEMVAGNEDSFYSSDIYEEIREMEKRIIKEREENKERDIRQVKEKLEKEIQDALRKIMEQIQELEKKLQQHEEKISEFERQLKEERNEEVVRELEVKLKSEIQQREETQQKLNELKEMFNKDKSEMEERHRQEMEKVNEMFKGEARLKAERYLMKIVLPEIYRTVWVLISKMQKQFSVKMEQKDIEILSLKQKVSELMESYRQLEDEYQKAVRTLEDLQARRTEEEQGDREILEEGESQGEVERLLEGEQCDDENKTKEESRGDKEASRAEKREAGEKDDASLEGQEEVEGCRHWIRRIFCCSRFRP